MMWGCDDVEAVTLYSGGGYSGGGYIVRWGEGHCCVEDLGTYVPGTHDSVIDLKENTENQTQA